VGGRKPRPKASHGAEALARGGFSVDLHSTDPIIQLRMWGFWNLEIAERIRLEIRALARELKGRKWSILVDSRDFLPQSAEITAHRRETMGLIVVEGCERIAAIVESQGTYSMQFIRIAGEAGVESRVFLDEVAALDWIRGRLPEG
jgi:hypothetical protein